MNRGIDVDMGVGVEKKWDLSGRSCLVTGATNGHGRAVARALFRMGADVTILGRNPSKCRALQQELAAESRGRTRTPDILVCDLSSRKEIDRAANEFLSRDRPLHVLINNAGIVNRDREESVDGVEMTFAVNYLSVFQLTLRLLDRIREGAPARIINVASDMHRLLSLKLEDPGHRTGYSWVTSYSRSKLAVVHFTLELARKLEGSGVTVNAVDPGPVDSGMALNNKGLVADVLSVIMKLFFPSPERAARTAVWLAGSNDAEGVSGGYFKYLTRRAPRRGSDDPLTTQRLWAISSKMTGVDFKEREEG